MISSLLFYIFSFLLIITAVAVVTVRNPVHSVLSLILCFLASAGLFILIGAEYIALTLIIIYVGAIAILFLFVVMMLDINFILLRKAWRKYMPLSFIIGIVLLVDLYITFDKSLKKTIILNQVSVPMQQSSSFNNTEAIGTVIYTDYILPFQIAGVILLVAMIGAIVLTHRIRTNVKKQDLDQQLTRTKENSLEVIKINIGEGV